MSMKTPRVREYKDGRTKQSFKDSCDINKILKKAQVTGTVSHLAQHRGEYGDFSNVDDLLDAQLKLKRGQEIFDSLPSEVRAEFQNNPLEYFRFVNDPKNVDKLEQVIPAIAEPGSYFPVVDRSLTSGQVRPQEPRSETSPTQAPESSDNATGEPTSSP